VVEEEDDEVVRGDDDEASGAGDAAAGMIRARSQRTTHDKTSRVNWGALEASCAERARVEGPAAPRLGRARGGSDSQRLRFKLNAR
jgi:hypothetical protein